MRKTNESIYAMVQLRYFYAGLRYRGTRETSSRRSFSHGQCYVPLPRNDQLQRFAKHICVPRRTVSARTSTTPEGAASPFAFVRPSIRWKIITPHVCTPHHGQLSPGKRIRRSMLSIRRCKVDVSRNFFYRAFWPEISIF